MNKLLGLALGLGLAFAPALAMANCNATANAPKLQAGTQPCSMDLSGNLRVLSSGGGGGGSAPYAATALGYQQLTSLTTTTALTVPSGATFAVISVEGQGVRYRDDGVAPTATVGQPIAAQTSIQYSGTLSALQFIQQAASATVDVLYYK